MSATNAAGRRNGKRRHENQDGNSTMPSKKLSVISKPRGRPPSSSRTSNNKSIKKSESSIKESCSSSSSTARSLRSTSGTRGTLDQKVAAAAEAERILRSAKVLKNQNNSHFSPKKKSVQNKSLGRRPTLSSSSQPPIKKDSKATKKTKATFTVGADKINPSPSKSISDSDARSRGRPSGSSRSPNVKNDKKDDKIKRKSSSSGCHTTRNLRNVSGRGTLTPEAEQKVVAAAERISRSAKVHNQDQTQTSSHFSPTKKSALQSLGRRPTPSTSRSSQSPIKKASEATKKRKSTFTTGDDEINQIQSKSISDSDARSRGRPPISSPSSNVKNKKNRDKIKTIAGSSGSRTTRSLRNTSERCTLTPEQKVVAAAERILRSAKVRSQDQTQKSSNFSPAKKSVLTKRLGRRSTLSRSSQSPIKKDSETIQKTKPTFTASADKINQSHKSNSDSETRSRKRPPTSSRSPNTKKGDKFKTISISSGSRATRSISGRGTLTLDQKVAVSAERTLRSAKVLIQDRNQKSSHFSPAKKSVITKSLGRRPTRSSASQSPIKKCHEATMKVKPTFTSGAVKINPSPTKSIVDAASDVSLQPKVVIIRYDPNNNNPSVVTPKKSVFTEVTKSEVHEPTPSTSASSVPSPNINQRESENLLTPTLSTSTLSLMEVGYFTELSTSNDDTSSLFGDEIGHCKPVTKRSMNSRKLKPTSLGRLQNHIIRNTESPVPKDEPVFVSPTTRPRYRPRRDTWSQTQHKHPSEIYGGLFSKTIS